MEPHNIDLFGGTMMRIRKIMKIIAILSIVIAIRFMDFLGQDAVAVHTVGCAIIYIMNY